MISLLVVNYRSAALTAQAIRTARANTSAALQVVIVDNSCDADEAARLQGLGDVLLLAETNRGYAGGVNLGRKSCAGETIVVSNPDVTFDAGAIDRLADELRDDVAVAGPALFWDDAHQWMLPPGDLDTGRQKIDVILASRSRDWFHQRDRRRFRERVAFWSLRKTKSVRMLSGAVMAIRAKDFDTIGGFDERFPLYFEETDFLRRIAEYRRRIVYVPDARCRHLFNQSASQVAESAAARYAQSELRYLEKWNGPWAAQMLKRFERPLPAFELAKQATAATGEFVIEASPLPSFTTAAGRFATRSDDFDLPSDVLASIRGEFHLRSVVRATGEVLATVKISA
jgi:N-acetylglucosaminyl-diphospho-decaprenol L-rhamnosyltransferase